MPFLDVCKLILPVVEHFGSALSIVKSDVGGNINRLESAYKADPEDGKFLYNIVRKEVAAGATLASSSNTNGLLWLTRAMDFLMAMLQNLADHLDWTLYQAASAAYQVTLKPYHGWIAASAFTVALNLCPGRKTFFSKLGPGDLLADISTLTSAYVPLLAENHEFLKTVGVDSILAS